MLVFPVVIFISLTESILSSTNHFDTLGLPRPQIDILGNAAWEIVDSDIKKSFREVFYF